MLRGGWDAVRQPGPGTLNEQSRDPRLFDILQTDFKVSYKLFIHLPPRSVAGQRGQRTELESF